MDRAEPGRPAKSRGRYIYERVKEGLLSRLQVYNTQYIRLEANYEFIFAGNPWASEEYCRAELLVPVKDCKITIDDPNLLPPTSLKVAARTDTNGPCPKRWRADEAQVFQRMI